MGQILATVTDGCRTSLCHPLAVQLASEKHIHSTHYRRASATQPGALTGRRSSRQSTPAGSAPLHAALQQHLLPRHQPMPPVPVGCPTSFCALAGVTKESFPAWHAGTRSQLH